MRTFKYLAGAALAAALCSAPQPAVASSHREAPAIALDPAADNTDTWAWVSKDKSKLYVVAAYNPLEEPSGGPNFHKFADEVLYEIHITNGNNSVDRFVYQFRFKTTPLRPVPGPLAGVTGGKEFFDQLGGRQQTFSVLKITNGPTPDQEPIAAGVPVAPTNYGPRTFAVVQKGSSPQNAYNDAYAASFIRDTTEGGRVWAGPRDDGFYVDLGGIFDLANIRAKGTAQDGVARFNCHAIVLEIPTASLTADGQAPGSNSGDRSTVGVWASASRRQLAIINQNGTQSLTGPFVQVSRLGLPLVNEAVIGLQDKDRFNATRPTTDVTNFGSYFLSPTLVRDAEAVGIYKDVLKTDANLYKNDRMDILDAINLKYIPGHTTPLSGTGDVLRVDMAVFPSRFPNGRPLGAESTGNRFKENDVTDTLLSLILLKNTDAAAGKPAPVKDNVDYNDAAYLDTIPFLPLPWSGFDQGHGRPTPAPDPT